MGVLRGHFEAVGGHLVAVDGHLGALGGHFIAHIGHFRAYKGLFKTPPKGHSWGLLEVTSGFKGHLGGF